MTYKVGIIGTGFGAKVHLPAFQSHQEFEVEIIAGRDPDKTQGIAKAAGISYTTNWMDLLKIDGIDIVAISTPPYLHYEMARKSLLQNKHILLEKPTTTTALQAKELTTLAQDNNLIGMLAHEFRYMPGRRVISKILKEDMIGNLREIHGNYYYGFAASPENPKFGWLWDSRYDGGLLGAMGSHIIDMIRSTTNLEIKEVLGKLYTRVEKRRTNEGEMSKVTADDGFLIEFLMEGDVSGIVNMSGTLSPAPSSRIIFAGDEGTVYLEDEKVLFGKTGDRFEEMEIPDKFIMETGLIEKDRRIPPFLKLLDKLSKSLKEGRVTGPSLIDGWRNQQVLDATKLSFQTGNRIRIVD